MLKTWPQDGPNMVWNYSGLGQGFSTVCIADGKIFTTGMVDKEGILFCLDWDGKELWKQSYGPEWTKATPGVRCTPTMNEGNIYVISGYGVVSCLNAADGKIVWQIDAAAICDANPPHWGYSESPLVVDNKVIFAVNGTQANVIALDKNTGKQVWVSGNFQEKATFSSSVAFEFAGRTVIAAYSSRRIMGIDAADGKLLWSHILTEEKQLGGDIHANSPVYHDGMLFTTSGYNTGAVMLKLDPNGTAAEKLWENKDFDVHHGSMVLVADYLYGANWKNNGDGDWMCVDWKTGKTMYQIHWENKGSITAAEGLLYCYEEKNGNVALVKPDPAGFNPISTFKITQGSGQHWAHPVICGKRLYIRHGDVLMAFDIAG